MKKEVLATTLHSLRSAAILSVLSVVVAPIVLLPSAASAEPVQTIAKRECFLGICWNKDDDDDPVYRDADDRDRYDDRYRRGSYEDINQIYREVLGRNADRNGLRNYAERVDRGWSLRQVRQDLAKSREAEDAINNIYRRVLGRNADRNGLRTYRDRLADGWSLRQVQREIENSREARDRGYEGNNRDRDRYNRDRDRYNRDRDRYNRDRDRDGTRDNVPVYRSPNDINNGAPVYRSPNDINN